MYAKMKTVCILMAFFAIKLNACYQFFEAFGSSFFPSSHVSPDSDSKKKLRKTFFLVVILINEKCLKLNFYSVYQIHKKSAECAYFKQTLYLEVKKHI